MKRSILTLLLVLLVTLSGCSILGGSPTTPAETPAASATATTPAANATEQSTGTADGTATEQRPQVSVTNGQLETVDATATFYSVQTLTGSDVRPPAVELRNLTERKNFKPGKSPLLAVLGFKTVPLAPDEPGGATTPTTGKVFLHRGSGSPAEIEQVLAHEYVHTVQFQTQMLPWLDTLERPERTTDLIYTRKMLIEGTAVFATDEYTARHLDVENQSTEIRDRFETSNASARLFWGQYYYGHRYVDGQISDSRNLQTVFENHPNTTEQLIHNRTRSEEPPAALAINQTAPGQAYTPLATDTQGEFVLRSALETELAKDRAAAAAAGWGNDSLASFRHTQQTDRYGWVWTVRMDDASEADELETALAAYANRRSNASDTTFEATRVDDQTVALTFGTSSFVENATATAKGTTVSVEVGA